MIGRLVANLVNLMKRAAMGEEGETFHQSTRTSGAGHYESVGLSDPYPYGAAPLTGCRIAFSNLDEARRLLMQAFHDLEAISANENRHIAVMCLVGQAQVSVDALREHLSEQAYEPHDPLNSSLPYYLKVMDDFTSTFASYRSSRMNLRALVIPLLGVQMGITQPL